jgi:4-hydroxy-tetrahydrodipicolinate synthase
MKLEGTFTAVVTPFREDAEQSIDWAAFDTVLDEQIAGGINGIVPCGTTGESPSLTHEEHAKVVLRTIERAKGKTLVVAGTGSNATREAIDLSRDAEKAGADAVMVVVPYYNKPTQEGLFRHFVAVAKAVRCPVVIYNIPGRTGIDLSADTLSRILEAAPNVLATKEATGNVLRAQELVRRHGDRLTVLSGDDALTLPMVACGARGVISVASNVLPRTVGDATRLALSGDVAAARKAHLALLPFYEAMFVEANPGPVKHALAHRGRIKDVVRGPLAPVTDATKKLIAKVLEPYAGSL